MVSTGGGTWETWQPYCFEAERARYFVLSGLWDEWKSPDGEIIDNCTILTTSPNSLVSDLHDRMPVIVQPDKYDLWLDPDVTNFELIRGIMKPYDAELMRRYPVSRRLNNSQNDDAESVTPITLEVPTQSRGFEPASHFPCNGLIYSL
jgi:putative SOS response-associated peptidase YedK